MKEKIKLATKECQATWCEYVKALRKLNRLRRKEYEDEQVRNPELTQGYEE